MGSWLREAGTGRRPVRGDAVLVTYVGRLADGTIFDSTAQPAGLLVSGAIPGFTEALLMMNEGGRYRFVIPPRLAYGARGRPGAVPATSIRAREGSGGGWYQPTVSSARRP